MITTLNMGERGRERKKKGKEGGGGGGGGEEVEREGGGGGGGMGNHSKHTVVIWRFCFVQTNATSYEYVLLLGSH